MFKRTINYGFVSDDIAPSNRKIDDDHYFTKQDIEDNQVEQQKHQQLMQDNSWNSFYKAPPPIVHKHKVKNIFHKLWLEFIGAVYWKKQRAHGMVIALHTATCLLIYALFGFTSAAYLAAVLFAINPANTQGGSIWLSGKIYNISTILALLMFMVPMIAVPLYLLTSFFSINALFAPVTFLMTPYIMLAFLPLLGIKMYSKILEVKKKVGTSSEMRSISPRKFIPYVKSLGYYTTLCLFPWKLALYHTFLWGLGVNKEYNKRCYSLNKSFYLGVAVFITLVGSIIYWWGQPFTFGLLWYLVNISMWCNAITYQQQISERCVHTANVGLMYALACIIINYPVVIACFVTMYVVRLYKMMPMYTNEYWHTEYSMLESPDCNYIWIARGMKKYALKNHIGAMYDFLEAKRCAPWEYKANFNAANMAVLAQDFKMAENLLDDCEKCMYDGQEAMMLAQVNQARAWIKEVRETKSIDMNKCQTVR